MFKFPFSNLHELNLDWILSIVKRFAELVPPMETAVEDVQALQGDVEQAVTDAQAAVEQANTAAETAAEALEVAEQAAAGTIADGAVTTAKLANNAVTTDKILNGTILSEDMAAGAALGNITDGSITAAKLATGAAVANIADGTLPGAKIADSSILGSKLADGAAVNRVISDGAVTTGKIADDAINAAKIDTLDTEITITNSNVVRTVYANKITNCAGMIFISFSMQLSYTGDGVTVTQIGTVPASCAPSSGNIEKLLFSTNGDCLLTLFISSSGVVSIRGNENASEKFYTDSFAYHI